MFVLGMAYIEEPEDLEVVSEDPTADTCVEGLGDGEGEASGG